MRELGFDLAADLLVTLAAAVGAVGFTVVGVLLDRAALDLLFAGATVQGAWELWMGTLAIYVGVYLLGYRTLRPGIAALR